MKKLYITSPHAPPNAKNILFPHIGKNYIADVSSVSPSSERMTDAEPDKMLGCNLRWSCTPFRGGESRNSPSRFILQKQNIIAGTDGPLALILAVRPVYGE